MSSVADELRANTLVSVELTRHRRRPARRSAPSRPSSCARSSTRRSATCCVTRGRVTSGSRLGSPAARSRSRSATTGSATTRPRRPGAAGRAATQGLENLRRRAEILGATIQLEGLPGRGAAVSLTMPVGTAAEAGDPARPGPTTQGTQETDDEPTLRRDRRPADPHPDRGRPRGRPHRARRAPRPAGSVPRGGRGGLRRRGGPPGAHPPPRRGGDGHPHAQRQRDRRLPDNHRRAAGNRR